MPVIHPNSVKNTLGGEQFTFYPSLVLGGESISLNNYHMLWLLLEFCFGDRRSLCGGLETGDLKRRGVFF